MKPGKIFLILFAAIIFAWPVWSQNEVPGVPEIRAQFNAINTDAGLKTDTFENEEFLEQGTDGGGMLTFYYRNDSIRKIVTWIGLSYGNTIREYYFSNDQLIFVYENVATFVENKNGERDLTKTETAFEGRYYIHDNRMIKKLTTGEKPFEDKRKDLMKELLTEADGYFKLFYKKK